MRFIILIALFFISCSQIPVENKKNDQYLYLEEIQSEQSLGFAKDHNQKTMNRFTNNKSYKSLKNNILKIYNDPEKIPFVTIKGEYVYNLWKDKKYVRGLWRRMKLKSYIAGGSKWETVIDIDKLAKREKKNWVWKRPAFENTKFNRVIISLSDGGKDATIKREFNLRTKKFVKNGFNVLKEAKTYFTWIDQNQGFIATNFGKDSLNKAGYPRILKHWKRGTKLKNAKEVYRIKKDMQWIWPWVDTVNKKITLNVSPEWYRQDYYHFNLKTHQTTKLALPEFVEIKARKNESLIVTPRKEWKVNGQTYMTGDLVEVNETKLTQNEVQSNLIFRPQANQSVENIEQTKSKTLIYLLEDVKPMLLSLSKKNGKWSTKKFNLPQNYATSRIYSNNETRDDFFLRQESFLSPRTFYYYNPQTNKFQIVKKEKSYFSGKDLKVEQHFAISKDGTKVPYFQFSKKNLKLDGSNPTLQYGYGGFQYALLPYYSKVTGKFWVSKGGVYVLANIRGGSEYGEKWHKQAKKKNRQNAYNDFIAISEDLIKRGVTSPEHLGIAGGSNGGLLTTVALTQRPDLYNAVLSKVPLTDMERFHKLLAGHSWMGEYGNPEKKDERDYLLGYSPFHQLRKKQSYPEAFVSTSTLDDRVHPGHARKFVAKMSDLGHRVIYFENIEGGHAGAANYQQRAHLQAMEYLYLYEKLGLK